MQLIGPERTVRLSVRPPRFTEDGCPYKKFFHTRYLMRMRLTPDCSKMLISTSSGYLLILHDLDLTQSLEVGSYRMLRARRTPLSSGNLPVTPASVLMPARSSLAVSDPPLL